MKKEQNLTPEQMIMQSNLREFAAEVGWICALEVGGKIGTEEAYRRIKDRWKKLKQSKHHLLEDPPADDAF